MTPIKEIKKKLDVFGGGKVSIEYLEKGPYLLRYYNAPMDQHDTITERQFKKLQSENLKEKEYGPGAAGLTYHLKP